MFEFYGDAARGAEFFVPSKMSRYADRDKNAILEFET
jgi:hypothetical protein